MKIALIVGSHREESQSLKTARYMAQVLAAGLDGTGPIETDIVSLAGNPLPLWDEEAWEDTSKWDALWKPISARLKAADGFVVVSPEWSGMVPAGLKNLFLLCSRGELAHKPALIAAVSAGMGGTYPVAELRMSSYKNTKIVYLPDHLILRNVEGILNGPEPKDEFEKRLRSRIVFSLKILCAYSEAMKGIREKGITQSKEFSNGM